MSSAASTPLRSSMMPRVSLRLPVELLDAVRQVVEVGEGPLQALARPDDPRVVPHRRLDRAEILVLEDRVEDLFVGSGRPSRGCRRATSFPGRPSARPARRRARPRTAPPGATPRPGGWRPCTPVHEHSPTAYRPGDRGAAFEVHLDPAAEVVRRRHDGDRLLADVDARARGRCEKITGKRSSTLRPGDGAGIEPARTRCSRSPSPRRSRGPPCRGWQGPAPRGRSGP